MHLTTLQKRSLCYLHFYVNLTQQLFHELTTLQSLLDKYHNLQTKSGKKNTYKNKFVIAHQVCNCSFTGLYKQKC